MPGEQGHSTMTAIPPTVLPVFNTGGSANGIDGRIQQAHAPLPQLSIRQQSFVPREISRNGNQDFGSVNGYTRCIGVNKETSHSRARNVESSSTQPLTVGYRLGNPFTVPITYQSVRNTHNGTTQALINGKSTVNNEQFKPSAVYSGFNGLSTPRRTSFEVPLPSYNFATQTFEHRVVKPKFSVTKTLKTPTPALKPSGADAIAMPKIVRTHPPISEKGADPKQSVAPQNNGGRKATSKPRTPKKRTQKEAEVLPHSHYTDSIDRAIKLACHQRDNDCMEQNMQHPPRPSSAMPCETVAFVNITKQRARHRSTDADAVPRKARKKHTKSDYSKSPVEHADASHSPTPNRTPKTYTRRVTGQYPQRIIITSKPLHTMVKQKLAAVENSVSVEPPTSATPVHSKTLKALPRHENLRSCLLSNGSSVPYEPSKVSVSAPAPSYYPGAMHTYGPQVFADDSVIPSTDPILPGHQSSSASTTHSMGEPPADQPLDYSMKTLRKLEETKPIIQPEVIDLSLPKQEPSITVEKSTPTAVIKPGLFYLPPVMPDAALRTNSTQQLATSQVITSVCQPSTVTEAAVLLPPIPQKAASTRLVNPYPMIAPTTSVRYQIDTSNLDTLCDVALATTQASAPPVNANGCRKGQRKSRKRQSSQKTKKVDNSSTPKTSRKKSKSAGKKREEKQIFIAKLDPAEPSLLMNHTSDNAANNVEILRQTAKPDDPPSNSSDDNVLTAGVDEVQVSDDEKSDTTLDADERPDATTFTNEMNACLPESNHLPPAPIRTPDLNCETVQKEVVTPPNEANADLEEKTVNPVHEITQNCDTAVIAEKKDAVVTEVKNKIETLQPEEKQNENVSSADVTEILEKAFVDAGTPEMKGGAVEKIQSSICQASRLSPNVTIQRLNSNEMRSNFSVSSQDGVIPIRPESLDSIMKPKKTIKTEPSSQDAGNENQPVNVEKAEVERPNHRVKDGLNKPIAEIASPKLDTESSEVAAILSNSEPAGRQSSTKIKSESEEVPFLPRFSCHSPIDLNEACCDEYDNMCQDLDVGDDDDCVEIIQDYSERPTVVVRMSEIVPEAETETDLNESNKETEIIFSPISSNEATDTKVTTSQGENIDENSQTRSKSVKKRKKRQRLRLTRTKKKAFPLKQPSVEEDKVANTETYEQPILPEKQAPLEEDKATSEETQVANQECVSEESPAAVGGSIAQQTPDDPDIKHEIQLTVESLGVSSIMLPTNANKDVDISPHKRKSLKLGYSLNSEFGIGEIIPKRRKLIKKDEKPIIIKLPNPPVVLNTKPICLLDSSESSDDESSIFKTEKAKQLVKKSHIQQKIALKESQKILKKAKDFMVKKEPNRLGKKGLLKSGSSQKSKSTSKSPTKSLATVQSTPVKTTEMQATNWNLSVDEEQSARLDDSSRESSRSRCLRPNGSRYVLSRGCGPWLVTRRETQLVQRSPQKINAVIDRKDGAEGKEVKASAVSEDSDSPKSTIQLKSFVRDPKEPEINCKLSDEPQRVSNAQILNQTVANKSLEKKVDDMDEKLNSLLGFKSLLTAKTTPTSSKLKAAVPSISKFDMKASKENFDPDQVLQVTYDQSGECVVGSEACKLTVITHDHSTFPFTISPNESYGEEEEPQPFVLTTFAKDASLKDKDNEQNIENSSVIPKCEDHTSEIPQALHHCESESTPPDGNPAQTTDNDSTSQQISTGDRNFNKADSSQATHSESIGGDAKLLSMARLLPPPPLKEECTSPPASANRGDVTGDICSMSSLDENCDVTLARPVNRVSSNTNNNNIFDFVHGQIPSETETPTQPKTVGSIAEDCSARADNKSTSNDNDTLNKVPKARMKGNWSSRDFIPVTNAKRPSYFSQAKMSKAKRDEKVYQVMQKMLNMGLIVNKAGLKPSDMARWPTSFDKYNRFNAPSPPWPKPGRNVKHEFISEEDIIIIKPCSVSLRRLDF